MSAKKQDPYRAANLYHRSGKWGTVVSLTARQAALLRSDSTAAVTSLVAHHEEEEKGDLWKLELRGFDISAEALQPICDAISRSLVNRLELYDCAFSTGALHSLRDSVVTSGILESLHITVFELTPFCGHDLDLVAGMVSACKKQLWDFELTCYSRAEVRMNDPIVTSVKECGEMLDLTFLIFPYKGDAKPCPHDKKRVKVRGKKKGRRSPVDFAHIYAKILESCPKIHSLSMCRIPSTGSGIRQLCDAIKANTELDTLLLSCSQLSIHAMELLFHALGNISTLSLARNEVFPGGMPPLCRLIRESTQLARLYIDKTGLDAMSVKPLCDAIVANESLRVVTMSQNNLYNIDLDSVNKLITASPLLTLDMSECYLGAGAVVPLSLAISKTTKLTNLHITRNGLNGAYPRLWAVAMGHSQTLTRIDIRGNRYTEEDNILMQEQKPAACVVDVLYSEDDEGWTEENSVPLTQKVTKTYKCGGTHPPEVSCEESRLLLIESGDIPADTPEATPKASECAGRRLYMKGLLEEEEWIASGYPTKEEYLTYLKSEEGKKELEERQKIVDENKQKAKEIEERKQKQEAEEEEKKKKEAEKEEEERKRREREEEEKQKEKEKKEKEKEEEANKAAAPSLSLPTTTSTSTNEGGVDSDRADDDRTSANAVSFTPLISPRPTLPSSSIAGLAPVALSLNVESPDRPVSVNTVRFWRRKKMTPLHRSFSQERERFLSSYGM